MIYALGFFRELFSKRRFILDLAIRDFYSTYLSSTLGLVWAFVEPAVYIGVIYLFFTKAIKFVPTNDMPFVPWLMTSMSIWMFFSGVTVSSSNIFKNHSYLLRRWNFNMSVLPVVAILNHLFMHAIFLTILIIVFFLSGIHFSLWWFQGLYYLFALCCFVLAISWITASLSLFIKDVTHVIGVLLQLGFWVSPIFWDINTFPPGLRIFMKINPLYYIMSGYRFSFLYETPFWVNWQDGLYFWSVTLVMMIIGVFTYKQLRPHFGDVI